MTESGHNVIKSPLPALITVVKEINEPRMPSLRGKMNAKKADIERYSAADLACDLESIGQMGSPTVVKKIFAPPVKGKGKIFKGEPEDTALKLAGELKDKGII
jgi:electron transfer flavoprotein beta subunit